jgi:uncharacterized protein YbjT (DUF2867 family)
MQGLLVFRSSIASTGKFFAAAGDAKVSVVDVRDIAGAAASLSLPGIMRLTFPDPGIRDRRPHSIAQRKP